MKAVDDSVASSDMLYSCGDDFQIRHRYRLSS